MSLLSICQDAATEIGFPSPSTIVGNTDQTAKQLLRLANREGEELSQSHDWQALLKEASITLVTGTQEYALASDYRKAVPSTTWNRTDKRPVINPVTSKEWAFLKGWTTINGLNLRARIRDNKMEFEQTITSSDNGDEIYYEYISKNWSEDSGGTAQQKFAADTDNPKLDEELMTQGIIWRFKKAKGLDWQEDFQNYQFYRAKVIARDGSSRTLSLGGNRFGQYLGVNVSDRDYG